MGFGVKRLSDRGYGKPNSAALPRLADRVAKGTESLRIWYAKQLCSRALELQQMTKILTADAFFSKKPFVDMVCAAGFTFVSRLQHNSYLRYAYTGEQKPDRGRCKAYGGKIDLSNLDTAILPSLKRMTMKLFM